MSGNSQGNYYNVENIYGRGGRLLLSAAGMAPISFGQSWFVDTVNGNDGLPGKSPDAAFRTMGKAFSVISSHDTICFVGKVKEQLVAPLGVTGVTGDAWSNTLKDAIETGLPAN